jgi:hypothetical protein
MREKSAQSTTYTVFEAWGSLRVLTLWPYKLGKCNCRAQCQIVHWSNGSSTHLSAHLCWLVGLRGPHNLDLYKTLGLPQVLHTCLGRYGVLLQHRDRLSIWRIVGRMFMCCRGRNLVCFACYMLHVLCTRVCYGRHRCTFSANVFYCAIRRIWL